MRVPAKNTPKKTPGGPEVVLCLTWKRFFFVSGFKIVIFWNDSLPLWDTILHLIAKYIPNWRNMTQNEIQMFLMWCGMCVFSLCGGIQFQACSVFSLFRLFEYFYYYTHTHTQYLTLWLSLPVGGEALKAIWELLPLIWITIIWPKGSGSE